MDSLTTAVNELKSVIKMTDFNTKNKLVRKYKSLKDILFERPSFHYSIPEEIKLFEKRFRVELSEELKGALILVGNRGYEFSELFDYNLQIGYCDSFPSEKFVEILVQHGVTATEIEACYYDTEHHEFELEKIGDIFDSCTDKTDLLIHCIPFHYDCGGCLYLVLNGPHRNYVAVLNHDIYRSTIIDDVAYKFPSYFIPDQVETIFDRMETEVKEITNLISNFSLSK